MAAAQDVRDMLDLPADGGAPRPAKKQKVIEKRPEGITRELFALLGERAPPIAINENKYKGRRKWMSKLKVRPWEMAPFENQARTDGLVLRHWQRKKAPAAPPAPLDEAAEGANATAVVQKKPDEPYAFAKYNVKAQLPEQYTDEQYEKFLKNDSWSREETDYLMQLAREYDLRWVIIADRYEWPPRTAESKGDAKVKQENPESAIARPQRTMEEMKSRYYFVAGNMLSLVHPPSEMSEAEFDTHEKMMNYNPEYERKRKELAEAQLNRSKEEVQEETYLLEELKRIVMNERQFVEDRKELYARLETPPSTGNTNMYQTSQGLNNLLSNLMAADKSRKRRSLLGTESLLSPVSPMVPQSQQQAGRDSKPPETPSTATGPTTTTTKKGGSAAAAAAAVQPQHQIKQLTAAEKLKYGVSQHERLTSGVHFRNDKAVKLTQAKSNIQTQKLAAALTELEIPPRLVMPTEKVVKEFEKLIQQVNLLLDARKVSDKIEGEIKILEAAKAERERKEKEKAEGTETQAEPAGEPKPAESPNREGANKRSASAMGTPDEKAGGNKKQKK